MHFGLLIGQVRAIGGMEKQAALLAGELRKRGIDATLFISGLRKAPGSRAMDLGSLRHRYLYHTRHTAPLARNLLRYHCKRLGISHLIAYNSGHAMLAVRAHTGCELIINVREIRFASDERLAERYREAAGHAAWVVTNSANTAQLLLENGISERGKIVVINNGIPLPDHEPPLDNKTILWVGSIKSVKDPLSFSRACIDIIRKDRTYRAVMVGDGDMKEAVRSLIARSGLAGNFELPGEVPFEEIPYREAAVFVNSSLRESSSNSLLEALSFGIPVAATDNPGNRFVLEKLTGHRLVPVSEPGELMRAIGDLLELGIEHRTRIFDESRGYIRERCSVSKMVDRYIQLAEGLDSGNR